MSQSTESARLPTKIENSSDFVCTRCKQIMLQTITVETPEQYQIHNGPTIHYFRHLHTLKGSWLVVKRSSTQEVILPFCDCRPQEFIPVSYEEGSDQISAIAREFDFGEGIELCECRVFKNTQKVEQSFSQAAAIDEHFTTVVRPVEFKVEF